jgi:hypothetical protein
MGKGEILLEHLEHLELLAIEIFDNFGDVGA